jgi:glyceraldehyde 3-phosphate dehydrogenase
MLLRRLVRQIKYSTNNELVSSDIVGTTAPSIYDSNATIVANGGKEDCRLIYMVRQ